MMRCIGNIVSAVFAFAALTSLATSCDNSHLELQSIEELVVEGWIEDGHAPIVLVTTTLPVSSDPHPLSDISNHVLRYAQVWIEHDGVRSDLSACISDRFGTVNYYTSSTLRGEVGGSYTLHVKWENYDAIATCTIPAPVSIDSVWFEKARNDTSYLAKFRFRNNPDKKLYYQSFRRCGSADASLFRAVGFTTLDGGKQGEEVCIGIMKDYESSMGDAYFHSGDVVGLKLAVIEKPMYDFWTDWSDSYNGTGFGTVSATSNIRGTVSGALGYWAGYGISLVETVCP